MSMTTIALQILKKDQTLICGTGLEELLDGIENSSRFYIGVGSTAERRVYVKPHDYSTTVSNQSYAANIFVSCENGVLTFTPLSEEKNVVLGLRFHQKDFTRPDVVTLQSNDDVKERSMYQLFFSLLNTIDQRYGDKKFGLLYREMEPLTIARVDKGETPLEGNRYHFKYSITTALHE